MSILTLGKATTSNHVTCIHIFTGHFIKHYTGSYTKQYLWYCWSKILILIFFNPVSGIYCNFPVVNIIHVFLAISDCLSMACILQHCVCYTSSKVNPDIFTYQYFIPGNTLYVTAWDKWVIRFCVPDPRMLKLPSQLSSKFNWARWVEPTLWQPIIFEYNLVCQTYQVPHWSMPMACTIVTNNWTKNTKKNMKKLNELSLLWEREGRKPTKQVLLPYSTKASFNYACPPTFHQHRGLPHLYQIVWLNFVSFQERLWCHWACQRIYAYTRRIIYASIPGSFLNVWEITHVTCAIISILLRNKHCQGRSCGEKKYRRHRHNGTNL